MTVRLRVEDPSGVAHARRAAEGLANRLGFDEQGRGEVAIVVTELGTNLLRHAGRGEIVLRPDNRLAATLDVIAWDRGPGIADVGRARVDGFSTGGGPGTGLGAITRIAHSFDLHTTPGEGTCAAVRLGRDPLPADVDGIAVAMDGEELSGDGWAYVLDGDLATIVLADGLGHGPEAAQAAAAATRQLRPGDEPTALLERMHAALRSTRGAAVAVATLNLTSGALRFAGIGNIAATIVNGAAPKSLASMNGTVGHREVRIRAEDYQLNPGAHLIMHSDGCRTGWDLARYPGLIRRSPLLTAAVLLRDFERGRDDASMVVARVRAERHG